MYQNINKLVYSNLRTFQKGKALYIKSLLVFISTMCFTNILLALQVNSYNHNNETAFIVVTKDLNFDLETYFSKPSVILSVDFKAKQANQLLEDKQISRVSVSPDRKYIAYANDKAMLVFDIIKQKIINKINRVPLSQIVWSDGGDSLAAHLIDVETLDEYLVQISLGAGKVESTLFLKYEYGKSKPKAVWGIQWFKNCKCFLYEVSDFPNQIEHLIVSIKHSELMVVDDIKSLFSSPEKKRYFIQAEYNDGGGVFALLDYQSDKKIADIGWSTISISSSSLLWKNGIVRILRRPGLAINTNTGEVLRKEIKYHTSQLGGDIAADRDGYVLIWDKSKNKILVQNITTLEMIKTYDAFWLKK